jgi:hypothetical protein
MTMSEYFRVLKRLEAERVREPAVPLETPRIAPRLVVTEGGARHLPKPAAPPPPEPAPVVQTAMPSLRAIEAYSTLFDNLRVLADGQPLHSLVFAAVSAAESVHPVASGLLEHVERLGMRARILKLAETRGVPALVPVGGPAAGERLPVCGHGDAWASAFGEWLRTAADADLVMVEGGPLVHSIDAALLARCCDGLVLVVRPGVTRRDELRLATERARSAGCRLLGLVMQHA